MVTWIVYAKKPACIKDFNQNDDLAAKPKYVMTINDKKGHSNVNNPNIDLQNTDMVIMVKKMAEAIKSLPKDIQNDVIDKIQGYVNQIRHSKLLGVELSEELSMKFFIQNLIKFVAENYEERETIQ